MIYYFLFLYEYIDHNRMFKVEKMPRYSYILFFFIVFNKFYFFILELVEVEINKIFLMYCKKTYVNYINK